MTVLASCGDGGTANPGKAPVAGPNAGKPFPTVGWPASDPLVTGVGGTYLCTDPTATAMRTGDSTSPPAKCQANPGVAEVGWTFSGGGFSHVFARPDYQSTLPAGLVAIAAQMNGGGLGRINPATTGWDPVTGLGTPNAAKLLPDLVAAVRAG